MAEPAPRSTRGTGLLEPSLARLRARRADLLLPTALRRGRLLDIGCGSYPYFLAHTSFREKYAIDRLTPTAKPAEIRFHALDLNDEPALPFPVAHFSAVTMLAVAEHLETARLIALLLEVHRVLEVGGRAVLTTPPPWSDPILRVFAALGLVSREEIHEHTSAYDRPRLVTCLAEAGFARERCRTGYFELGLNLWATADR